MALYPSEEPRGYAEGYMVAVTVLTREPGSDGKKA
jgi:hypothetical protein